MSSAASAGQRTVAPPLFPDPGVLDAVLYAYLRRSDRMGWSPYDLVAHERVRLLARPERLSDQQLSALKTVLYVEDHLPSYVAEYLRNMTDPQLPDEQHILNRKTLHYVFRWVSEEDRHAHVLELYLTKTGLVSPHELEIDMVRERKTAYHFPYQQLVESFIYLALQEKATHLYYRALAKDINEPLLKVILGRMANDEASHAKFFYDLLIGCHREDLKGLAKRISAVARDFRMPVQANLSNYRRQILGLMQTAPSYRHADVFTNIMQAVEQASRTYGQESLALISPGTSSLED